MTSKYNKLDKKSVLEFNQKPHYQLNGNRKSINRILKNNIIIDTLSHGPILWDSEINNECNELLKQNLGVWKTIEDVTLNFADRVVLDDDYFEKYSNAWKNSGVTCVSFTIGPIHEKPYSYDGVFHNYAFLTYMIENRKELFLKILNADDIYRAYKEKKIGLIMNLQDLKHIELNLDLLQLYYMMGIRIMQLTYNTKNQIGTGCTVKRDRGLTDFGLEVIEKLNNLGILIDISHCGTQTSMDAVKASKYPVVASHTFSKEIYNHDRGKSDELLKAIAEKGGYIGILAVYGFLTNKLDTTIEDWVDHIDYIIDLVGIDHVGIGTDFYGMSLPKPLEEKVEEFISRVGFRKEHNISFTKKVKGFEDYTKFPNLVKVLSKRGYSTQEIKKIAGENFLRIFKRVVG